MVVGTYERPIMAALRHYLRPGMVAYDVGAHAGYITLALARAVGPGGRVLAFEANPRNRLALGVTIDLNHMHWVDVLPDAVTDRVGVLRFATFDYSTVGQIYTAATPSDAMIIDVPCTTLDEIVYGRGHPPPAVIKIDVEGAEVSAVRGAFRLIREHRPVLIAEARATTGWHAVVSDLAALGYREEAIHRWSDNMADIVLIPANL